MTSLSLTSPKPLSLSSRTFVLTPHHPHSFTLRRHPLKPPLSKPISANPSQQQQQQELYQPFRPPPPPLPPKFRSLDTPARLEVLTNRLGLWFELAPLIPALLQEGFSPSVIEQITGITSLDQNCFVVASQVRQTLTDPETLAFFENSGSEILYEIRLLSTSQRNAAARYLVENNSDAKAAQELARAIKDFPKRRGDKGWESFDYVIPADCLAFMYYRQALEHKNLSEQRTVALQQALEVAVSDKAKKRILGDLEGGEDSKDGVEDEGVVVPVVKMKVGEVAEAGTVVVFPVCKAEDGGKGVDDVPWECRSEGEFGVVVAEKGWSRWVVLPGWLPVVGLKRGGVVVAFRDARVLPWKANRWYKEEPILVVADRGRKEVVADDGFYLVLRSGDGGRGDGLKVERGLALKENDVKESLGTVVLVVRPPREESDDQLQDEDWE
ncbi:hypothetical protein RHGRI_014919 [Rhododendron griersonianum]|uniref:Rubisco accumulation factor 1.1, chloroplastic n=1 Tax=Rhododendron griersonianum TaxID=479676 RepID=A0AAV6KBA0_9ERIC|nr:hypothetical protein RHGRI_014919 [Rhododendron griersonianum]